MTHPTRRTAAPSARTSVLARPRRRRPRPRPRTPLDRLIAAPATWNPALVLSWQLAAQQLAGRLDFAALIAVQPALEAATAAGEAEVQQGRTILAALTRCPAHAAGTVPDGF